MGVTSYFGAKVDGWEWAIGLDPDVMKNVGMEWGDKGDGVVVEVDDMRKGAKEILFDELLLRYPKFLTAVVDDGVLIGVLVDGVGTGRGVEEVGEEVFYRGNGCCNNGRWKGGDWDVLNCNVLLRIESKMLVDKEVLGGCWEEIFLLVFMVLGFVGGDVGKDIKTIVWGGGDGSTGDDIGGTVGDVEEREVFNIVKGGPDKFGGLRGDGLEDTGGDVKGTWVVPSIVRAL